MTINLRTIIFAFVITILAALLHLGSSGLLIATPVVQWTPNSLTESVFPGEVKTISVSFTPSQNINDVLVQVVPELQPFVQVNPASFGTINEGQTVNLDIIISAPVDSDPESFSGTIKLKRETPPKNTYAQPLPLTINVASQEFVNEEGGYSLLVPQSWQVIVGALVPSSIILIPPEKSPDPSFEYQGDIFIDILENPGDLNLIDFYESVAQINLFEASQNYSFFQLNGLDAVRFEGVSGMLPSTIVSVKLSDRIAEITDFNEGHQGDGIFDGIVSSFNPL